MQDVKHTAQLLAMVQGVAGAVVGPARQPATAKLPWCANGRSNEDDGIAIGLYDHLKGIRVGESSRPGPWWAKAAAIATGLDIISHNAEGLHTHLDRYPARANRIYFTQECNVLSDELTVMARAAGKARLELSLGEPALVCLNNDTISWTRRVGIATAATQGDGCTRIDAVLTNPAATMLVSEVEYLWKEAAGADHVPLRVRLQVDGMDQKILRAARPVSIQMEEVVLPTQPGRNADFARHWATFDHSFQKAVRDRDIGGPSDLVSGGGAVAVYGTDE